MRKMKYVLNVQTMHFAIFPNHMKHSDMVNNISDWTSAGFVVFETSEKDVYGEVIVRPICFGASVSLSLKAGEDDSRVLFNLMREENQI